MNVPEENPPGSLRERMLQRTAETPSEPAETQQDEPQDVTDDAEQAEEEQKAPQRRGLTRQQMEEVENDILMGLRGGIKPHRLIPAIVDKYQGRITRPKVRDLIDKVRRQNLRETGWLREQVQLAAEDVLYAIIADQVTDASGKKVEVTVGEKLNAIGKASQMFDLKYTPQQDREAARIARQDGRDKIRSMNLTELEDFLKAADQDENAEEILLPNQFLTRRRK